MTFTAHYDNDHTVELSGELDMATVIDLRLTIDSVPYTQPIMFDLARLTFFDASGLNEIARAARTRPVTVINASVMATLIFTAAQLGHLLAQTSD